MPFWGNDSLQLKFYSPVVFILNFVQHNTNIRGSTKKSKTIIYFLIYFYSFGEIH